MKLFSVALTACLILNAGSCIAAENVVSTYTESSSSLSFTASWQRSGLSLPDRIADEFVARKAAEFRATAQEEHAALQDIRGEETPPLEMNLKGTLSGNGRTLSLLWEEYVYTGGAHGNLILSSQNHMLPGAEVFTLADLFPRKDKALKLISELSRKKLLARGLPEDMVNMGTVPEEENFCTFVLEKDGITFYFSPYQVGPWAEGVVTVSLSLGELSDAAPRMSFWE